MVKKTDFDTKITEIETKLNNHKNDEYIITPKFNKLTPDLVKKTDFDDELLNLNRKITTNKTMN